MTLYWQDTNGRNWPVCSCLKAWLTAYQNELLRVGEIKRGLDLYQTIGGAPQSAGYHLHGGNVDTGQTSKHAITIAREMGGAAFGRGPLDGMVVHCHIALKGCPHMGYGPRWQVTELEAGRNGLANRRGDRGPRAGIKWPLRTYTAGIKWAKSQHKPTKLTVASYNLPGPDKIDNPAARIKAAAKLVKRSNPHIIGWNELVGTRRGGSASIFAHDVDAALGRKWRLVKPTTPLNENYISYRGDRLAVIAQYPDSILEARTGGRHLTRVVFKHANGLVFAVGQTHLVNDGGSQGARDRQTQARDALASMKAVTAKHDNCGFIIQGDMNTSSDLHALVSAGMKRTRKYADKGDGALATYTNYSKTAPSNNPTDWEIDQTYVSSGFYVHTYSVLRDLVRGLYRKPRPSDHDPVVSTISA